MVKTIHHRDTETQRKPLAGLNITVTRPREQAAQLAQRIEQAGGRAILFPLLKITPLTDSQPLRDIVSRLYEFDLAIFISPNAVRYGCEAINAALLPSPSDETTSHSTRRQSRQVAGYPASGRGAGGEGFLALPPNLKVATVGEGSARALRALGIQQIIAPQDRFDSEALLALPELQQIAGWRVVIFRGDGGRELLGDTLKARGATVEYAECYQRSRPQQDASALLATAPHAITVTSSEALGYLRDMLDEQAWAHLAAVPLFVQHARIAEKAHSMGWRNVVTTAAGDDGLLEGLIAWAKDKC